jgi:predicted O-methyltransferase YrrM
MSIKSATRRLLARYRKLSQRSYQRKEGLAKISGAIDTGLPRLLEKSLKSLVLEDWSKATDEVALKVEAIRKQVANLGKQKIPIIYSPKPCDPEEASKEGFRPSPGEKKYFEAHKLADQTSVSESLGRFLYSSCSALGAKSIIELGACVGVGSSYLASASNCTSFIGIEGAPELAKIANQSVANINPKAKVINGLFDDVLDDLLPNLKCGLDGAWIDGHHEREATLHYLKRLQPHLSENAIVLFDDIYWSDNMLEAWKRIEKWPGFSCTVNLGLCGFGIWTGNMMKPINFDLSAYVGHGSWHPANPLGLNT